MQYQRQFGMSVSLFLDVPEPIICGAARLPTSGLEEMAQ